jgi:hypothetical protein
MAKDTKDPGGMRDRMIAVVAAYGIDPADVLSMKIEADAQDVAVVVRLIPTTAALDALIGKEETDAEASGDG